MDQKVKLVGGSDAKDAVIHDGAFEDVDHLVIAVRVWRFEEESWLDQVVNGVVNDTFEKLIVFEPDLDPDALDHRTVHEELNFTIVSASFEGLDEKDGFGTGKVEFEAGTVLRIAKNKTLWKRTRRLSQKNIQFQGRRGLHKTFYNAAVSEMHDHFGRRLRTRLRRSVHKVQSCSWPEY